MKKLLKKMDFDLNTYYRKYVIIFICIGVAVIVPTELDVWYEANSKTFAPYNMIITSNIKLFIYFICSYGLYELMILTYKKLK
jgi:hypothetical protein